MSGHSILSPSSSERWLACSQSLLSEEPSTTSIYAAQGTVAHSVCETCLRLGVDPESMLGFKITEEGFEIEVDQEMVDAAAMYLKFIQTIAGETTQVSIEKHFTHLEMLHFGGTVDCIVKQKHIVDFKYGSGVLVSPEKNTQLGCYALLMFDHFQIPIDDVWATIIQPRSFNGDQLKTALLEKEFLLDLYRRITSLHDSLIAEELSSLPYVAGDHCRFCPRMTTCPELHQLTMQSAIEAFQFEDPYIKPVSMEELAKEVLDKAEPIRHYLKSIEDWAHQHILKGGEVKGWKVVQSIGNRKYNQSEIEIIDALQKLNYPTNQICNMALKSPAQLEKVVGKEFVNSICSRSTNGTTLVPSSNPKPAISYNSELPKLDEREFENVNTI